MFSKIGKAIYDKYIPDTCKTQVNLKDANRKPIEEALKSGVWKRDTYKKAQDEVMNILCVIHQLSVFLLFII